MSTTVDIDGAGPIVVSPTGGAALLKGLLHERGARGQLHAGEIHAATRQRLLGQGLIEIPCPGGSASIVNLTPLGRRVANALGSA